MKYFRVLLECQIHRYNKCTRFFPLTKKSDWSEVLRPLLKTRSDSFQTHFYLIKKSFPCQFVFLFSLQIGIDIVSSFQGVSVKSCLNKKLTHILSTQHETFNLEQPQIVLVFGRHNILLLINFLTGGNNIEIDSPNRQHNELAESSIRCSAGLIERSLRRGQWI